METAGSFLNGNLPSWFIAFQLKCLAREVGTSSMLLVMFMDSEFSNSLRSFLHFQKLFFCDFAFRVAEFQSFNRLVSGFEMS